MQAPDTPSGSASAPIDPLEVRRLFTRTARIKESAFLRREIALRMHERLALVKIAPGRVLDAGCGDGADLAQLHAVYPESELVGLDAADALLAQARDQQAAAAHSMNRVLARLLPSRRARARAGSGAALVSGGFESLPLAPNSIDLIWSNLALHWHPQPDLVFAEWRRVLRVDGLLMFSCFGPDTFKEVAAAFSRIDSAPHVLPFVDMHDFGDMLVNAGFATPVMDMEKITVTYDSARRLLDDVRAFGGNPLRTRRKGLLGRRAWQVVIDALEQQRNADGKIPLTFEIVYGHAFRPVPRTTASGESIIRLDLKRK
ncbi:methyltransferase domain-containing protein [Noviherbaspirillum galbum]|uniref:Malonyl-[acyl-carrier protein] O-methyltransferase n=1 Tax=Noviherbaspirillum galbum TaxID=2709383 RepID=A0A6B3SUA8_9BURK|nr:methyltransferase domain-containing protein [Noviherbaspirillum galbum]NEX64307.1 methyltransferase domain-containing protein [Noviherbaspirillum galbum]